MTKVSHGQLFLPSPNIDAQGSEAPTTNAQSFARFSVFIRPILMNVCMHRFSYEESVVHV